MENRNTWENYTDAQIQMCDDFSKGYIDFLSECKTERECIKKIVADAEAAGYRDLEEVIKSGEEVKTGDKLYRVKMDKTIIMFMIGSEDIENGLNILGAHIDSPRMDIKQNPVYEDGGFAYLDTHYYGGIKKYQWVTLPLAIHGVVIKKDGTKIEINVGEKPEDPVFFISDLLIHLADEQMVKNLRRTLDLLDEDDDVQQYYTNWEEE